MKQNRKSFWILLAAVGAFALVSCEKNPASSNSPTPSDSFAKTAASAGVSQFSFSANETPRS
jgi:hypothetical protein